MSTESAEAAKFASFSPADVAVVGRPCVDVYAPLAPDNTYIAPGYVLGGKDVLARGDAGYAELTARRQQLIAAGAEHFPGGIMNALAGWVGVHRDVVRFVSALGGAEDPESEYIKECVAALNTYRHGEAVVQSWTVEAQDYRNPGGVIERRVTEGKVENRMSRLTQGDPLHPHLPRGFLAQAFEGTGLVIAASVNDPVVSQRIFAETPTDAVLVVNWGSYELKHHIDGVQGLMEQRPPSLVSVNLAELQKITQGHNGMDESEAAIQHAKKWAEMATGEHNRRAQRLVCTLGKFGMVYATEGGSIHVEAAPDPIGCEMDTLGSGDRVVIEVAAGLMSNGLTSRKAVEQTLAIANAGAARVLLHRGGHGDWFAKYSKYLQTTKPVGQLLKI